MTADVSDARVFGLIMRCRRSSQPRRFTLIMAGKLLQAVPVAAIFAAERGCPALGRLV
ncbi:MAG: hypothetical protein JWO25_1484, partial [Alphaproteobacteria bacterium]|nr:hypothetical protein [Alphaproteobacteria bacterium]